MYLPSGKLEAKKSCSNFSKASLRNGLRVPVGLSRCLGPAQ